MIALVIVSFLAGLAVGAYAWSCVSEPFFSLEDTR